MEPRLIRGSGGSRTFTAVREPDVRSVLGGGGDCRSADAAGGGGSGSPPAVEHWLRTGASGECAGAAGRSAAYDRDIVSAAHRLTLANYRNFGRTHLLTGTVMLSEAKHALSYFWAIDP